MNGELPTVVKEENGKEVTYIIVSPSATHSSVQSKNTGLAESVEIDYKQAYEDLNKEYLILKTKYQKLVDMLEG
jgi:peptide methionine sulfoxide reductase MsrA